MIFRAFFIIEKKICFFKLKIEKYYQNRKKKTLNSPSPPTLIHMFQKTQMELKPVLCKIPLAIYFRRYEYPQPLSFFSIPPPRFPKKKIIDFFPFPLTF